MSNVFGSSAIGEVELKNRIFRSATHEGLGSKDGYPMNQLTELYVKLAKGGVGAIITGYAAVQTNGRTTSNMLMIDNDEYIEQYLKLTSKVKAHGTALFLQIAHGGGHANAFGLTSKETVAPSKKKYPLSPSVARELLDKEIEEIIDNFVRAIERAQKAGFDGVQLHSAHGYLLYEFLSSHLNNRKDRWGGSTENRFRIIAEIMQRARRKVGNYPILVKFSANDGDKNGMRLKEALRFAELFQKAGVDAIEVSCGSSDDGYNTIRVPKIPMEAAFNLVSMYREMPLPIKILAQAVGSLLIQRHTPLANYNVAAAEQIKQHIDIPVIVTGGIRTLSDIEKIIGEEKADYVSMSRPFIIEPDLVNKFKTGKQVASRCIDCGYCLWGVWENPIRCYYGKLV